MLSTARLFFRMLASPYICFTSAGVAQSAASTRLCHLRFIPISLMYAPEAADADCGARARAATRTPEQSMTPTSLTLLKGTLDVLILRTLSGGPMHGYAISRWIRERSDEAFRIEEGALYPALRRLEERGLIRGEWSVSETGREAKYYALTDEGRRGLRRELRDWGRYVAAMSAVLQGGARG